jgi:hypothetical protein
VVVSLPLLVIMMMVMMMMMMMMSNHRDHGNRSPTKEAI